MIFKSKIFKITMIFVLIFVFVSIIEAIPKYNIESLAGEWKGKSKASIRKNEGFMKYKFNKSKDEIDINISISENGNVNGNFGKAKLVNCQVKSNKGYISSILNLGTEYVIKGQLIGNIFDEDNITNKNISIPFDLKNNILEGSFFQLEGWDLYPISDFKVLR